jgi:putrescine transport system substrate-binding protein
VTRYGSINRAALPHVAPQHRDNPAVYHSTEDLSRLAPQLTSSPETSRLVTRLWTRFRSGE